jgi:hypothetical protein
MMPEKAVDYALAPAGSVAVPATGILAGVDSAVS